MTQQNKLDHKHLCEVLTGMGVLINPTFENDAIRLVTHKDVNQADIDYLSDCLKRILKGEQIIKLTVLPNLDIFRDRNTQITIDNNQPEQLSSWIDMRSDTVTLPSHNMRIQIATSPVGDDCYMDDLQVNTLQSQISTMFGKQQAIFMPSGTMANLVAIMGIA
jgi:hypothetical protein